jgi:hypothetical protein
MLPPSVALSHSFPSCSSSKVRGNEGGGVSVSLFIRHVPSVMPHLGSVTGAAASSRPTATPVAVTVVVTVVVVPFAVVLVAVVVGIVVGESPGHCAALPRARHSHS